jgi:hypothetical protein
MPLVQDFVPIAERFEQAGMALVSGSASWLAELVGAAVAPDELVSAEFGAARSVEHAVIVPLHWESNDGSFTTLDADLRLEPVPPLGSHLGLSGTYEVKAPDEGGRDALDQQHLIEACVRRFLTAVAATLERGGVDVDAVTAPCQ